VTDGDNRATTYTYDPAGELTQTNRADSSVLRTDYWPDGSIHDQYDAANAATTYSYDSLGHLSSISDPLTRVTNYVYDGVGNLLTTTDPSSRTSTRTYDAANQLTKFLDGSQNIGYVYDDDGQRTSMTDATGTSTWVYD